MVRGMSAHGVWTCPVYFSTRDNLPGHLAICVNNIIIMCIGLVHDIFSRNIYIIREEASIFAPQRIPFYKDPRVAACTVGKVRSSTVFMCVCSTFRPSDFLLFIKNGFVVGVRCQGNREPPADSATTPLSQRHSWLGSP